MESISLLSEFFMVSRAIAQEFGSLPQTVDEERDYACLSKRVKELHYVLSAYWKAQDEKLLPFLHSKMTFYFTSKGGSEYSQAEINLPDHDEQLNVISCLLYDVLVFIGVGVEGGAVRRRVKRQIRILKIAAAEYLQEEEETLTTIFKKCLSRADQGCLLIDMIREDIIFWMLGVLNSEDRAKFLAAWYEFADKERAAHFSEEVSRFSGEKKCGDLWKRVENQPLKTIPQWNCSAFKHRTERETLQMRNFCVNCISREGAFGYPEPFIELRLIHSAVRSELSEMRSDVRDLNPSDDLEIRNLQERVNFLRQVHDIHSSGEDEILLAKLPAEHAGPLNSEHKSSTAQFEAVVAQIDGLLSIPKGDLFQKSKARKRLANAVDQAAKDLMEHLEEEESNLLPLAESIFPIQDQEELVAHIRRKFPIDFLEKLIPWMLQNLTHVEQVELIRNVRRTSKSEFKNVASALQRDVESGRLDPSCWWCILADTIPVVTDSSPSATPSTDENANEREEESVMVSSVRIEGSEDLAVPSVPTRTRLSREIIISDETGPVGEVMRVHKAIRVELRAILDYAKYISLIDFEKELQYYRETVASLTERVSFLSWMVQEHSRVEDDVLLPKLEERVPGISGPCEDEHSKENKLFARLLSKLERLQQENSKEECTKLARRVRMLSRALLYQMNKHLDMEEKHLWPVLISRFSVEEQEEVVGRIFGQTPAAVLQEMLSWMDRVLSASESSKMIENILAVTRTTKLDEWLRSWFPKLAVDVDQSPSGGAAKSSRSASQAEIQKDRDAAATVIHLSLLEGETNDKHAADADTVSTEKDKTTIFPDRMTQRLSTEATGNGRGVNGCSHYRRNCMLVAKCCGNAYMCRHCHDDAESHKMDTKLTEEMVCLFCRRRGPTSKICTFEDCGQVMGSYFCDICKHFDDDDANNRYHCHSCNTCYKGKGLGTDFFHCMKCDICWSMKFAQGHECKGQQVEVECSVCNQSIKRSNGPVKHLCCGHFMHVSCFTATERYCRLCSAALTDTDRAVWEADSTNFSTTGLQETDSLARENEWLVEHDHVRSEVVST